jgi:hypothetical protein
MEEFCGEISITNISRGDESRERGPGNDTKKV